MYRDNSVDQDEFGRRKSEWETIQRNSKILKVREWVHKLPRKEYKEELVEKMGKDRGNVGKVRSRER